MHRAIVRGAVWRSGVSGNSARRTPSAGISGSSRAGASESSAAAGDGTETVAVAARPRAGVMTAGQEKFSWNMAAKSFPIGLVSGSVGACAGIGGATITIPLLCKFLGLKQRDAAASALLAVCGTVCGSAYVFYSAGQTDVETASYLAVAGAAAAPLGVLLSGRLPAVTLRRLLGSFMMLLAPLLPLRKYLEKGAIKLHLFADEEPSSSSSNGKRALLLVGGGAVGVLSGTLGVSGGPLVTPTVALLSSDDNFHKVLGTSFAAMTLPVLSGSIAYLRSGNVRLGIVPFLLSGTILGATLGSKAALQLPGDYLQYAFGLFLFLAGLRIFRIPL